MRRGALKRPENFICSSSYLRLGAEIAYLPGNKYFQPPTADRNSREWGCMSWNVTADSNGYPQPCRITTTRLAIAANGKPSVRMRLALYIHIMCHARVMCARTTTLNGYQRSGF